MTKCKALLRKPCLVVLALFLFLEFLPVSGKSAEALRLCENYYIGGHHKTYYALQPDGDLISWGNDPGELIQGVYPYFMRQKIARNVTSFACGSYSLLYVDGNHILWENYTHPQALQVEKRQRVQIMEDVKEVAADDRYVLALKMDGTVWTWPGNILKYNQQQRVVELSDTKPVRIAENMQAIFAVDYSFFALTKENALVSLSLSGGKPAPIAKDAKEVSLFYTSGRTVYQYLTQQGEVYTFKTRYPKKIAEQVHSLCTDGLLKEDHSLWTWEGTYPEDGLVKIRSGVRSMDSHSFFADSLGRLHWRTIEFELPRPSRSIRWLDPTARNWEVLFLCLVFLLCKCYQKYEKNLPDCQEK